MIAALCHRIEMSSDDNVALDVEVLEALMATHGAGDRDFFGRHGFGLIGNLTRVLRLLEEMLPGLRWDVRNTFCGTSLCAAVVDASNGVENPYTGRSKFPANALLAAGLRAYAAVAQAPLLVAVNDDVPARDAANDERRAKA